jgi:3-oxoacyl-[acyl-carrier protein] reductase
LDLKLKDQVVFVAGSSRGIGRAIAAALLDEGARVVLTGRDAASLEIARVQLSANVGADRMLAIAGDFGDAKVIAAAFERTLEVFGRVDHLIANLGTGSGKPGWEQEESEWERLFEANFFASVRLTQGVLPYLLKNDAGGSVLYISSITGVEATAAPLPYSAAKGALNNYAKNLARQLGAQRVRVNTIAPGNIYFAGGSWERRQQADAAAVERMLKAEVPEQRFGTPDEIASLACYLCSAQAGFATGSCYVMDGGQTRSL